MICPGVVSKIETNPKSDEVGPPGVTMFATVRFGDGWITQRFRLIFGKSTILVLGEPVFVEYRKVAGDWRFFDVRRTLRREKVAT